MLAWGYIGDIVQPSGTYAGQSNIIGYITYLLDQNKCQIENPSLDSVGQAYLG